MSSPTHKTKLLKSRNKSSPQRINISAAPYDNPRKQIPVSQKILKSSEKLENYLYSASSGTVTRDLSKLPTELYKFMKTASREILQSESDLRLKELQAKKAEDTDECDSQGTSQSIISIHKRYNQSSYDKQMLNTSYDPHTINSEKLGIETLNDSSKHKETIEAQHRNRLLYSTVYKRCNQSIEQNIKRSLEKQNSNHSGKKTRKGQDPKGTKCELRHIPLNVKTPSNAAFNIPAKLDKTTKVKSGKNTKPNSQTPTTRFANQQKETIDQASKVVIAHYTRGKEISVIFYV